MADTLTTSRQSLWRESGAGSIGAAVALVAGLGVDLEVLDF